MSKLFAVFLALVCWTATSDETSKITTLTDDNFETFTKKGTSDVVLMFWAPWNEDSKDAVPDYEAAADAASNDERFSTFSFGILDCTSESKKSCASLKIRAFPAFVHLKDGEVVSTNKGAMSTKAISSWANPPPRKKYSMPYHALYVPEMMDDTLGSLTLLNATTHPTFIAKGKTIVAYSASWCFLSVKAATTFLEAAHQAGQGFAAIDCGSWGKPCSEINIQRLPTFVLYQDGEEVKRVSGMRSAEYFVEFYAKGSEAFFELGSEFGDAVKWFEGNDNPDNNIMQLNKDNFEEYTSSHKTMVTFYSSTDGYFAPTAQVIRNVARKLAEDDNKLGTMAVMECVETEDNKEICANYEDTGYPPVHYFGAGETDMNFAYQRNEDGFLGFLANPIDQEDAAKQAMEDPTREKFYDGQHEVTVLNDYSFTTFVTENKRALMFFYAPWCGHCKETKPAIIQLAATAKKEDLMPVVAIDCTKDEHTCKLFNIEGYPHIGILDLDMGTNLKQYAGSRDYYDLLRFVKTYGVSGEDIVAIEAEIEAEIEADTDAAAEAEADAIAAAVETENMFADRENKVHMIPASAVAFYQFIEDNARVLVFFHAPWCAHCKNAVDEVAIASMYDDLEGVIAGVNCDDPALEGVCTDQGVEGFPTFKLYRKGRKKAKVMDIKPRTAENIARFIKNPMMKIKDTASMDVWKGSSVKVLGDAAEAQAAIENNDHLFVFYYAHWCRHSNKLTPQIMELAEKAPANVPIAAFDCELSETSGNQYFCARQAITGTPMLRLYSHGELYKYAGDESIDGWMDFIEDPPELIPAFSTHPDVTIVAERNFTDYLEIHPDCFVMFYSHWEDFSSILPVFEAAAEKFQKEHGDKVKVSFVAFNCELGLDTCDFLEIKEYPQFYMFQSFMENERRTFNNGHFVGKASVDNFVQFALDPAFEDLEQHTFIPSTEDSDLSLKLMNPAEFKDHVKLNKHVLLFVYATWCGHCHKAKPDVEDAAKALEGRATVVCVNAESDVPFTQSHDIKSFPYFAYYHNGELVKARDGNPGKLGLMNMIETKKTEL